MAPCARALTGENDGKEIHMSQRLIQARDVMQSLPHAQSLGMIVAEMADLWFHCLIALAHYGLSPEQVLDELERRAGTSGIEEKALRKVLAREGAGL